MFDRRLLLAIEAQAEDPQSNHVFYEMEVTGPCHCHILKLVLIIDQHNAVQRFS